MNRKIIALLFILVLAFSLFSFVYATDVVIDLDSTQNTNQLSNTNNESVSAVNSSNNNTVANTASSVDNTIYTSTPEQDISSADETQELSATTTTTADYDEDSAVLSLGNIINIVLIVVGIVLILLGIAIIIRLK